MGNIPSKFVQEMGNKGFDCEILFTNLFTELDYITKELLKNASRNDLCVKYTLLLTVRKMLDVWQSIHLICNNNQDYTSQIALSRVTIDNYAFLHLLFIHTTDAEEREARLLLYVLDGLRLRRRNVQSMKHNYDPQYISKEEADATKKQCSDSVIADNTVENEILKKLGGLLNGKINLSLIEKSDWKYKNYEQPNNKKNSYSWTELYTLFDSCNDMKNIYMGYFSQFIHGLSVSNMQYGVIQDDGFIYSIGIVFMNLTKNILYNVMNDEITKNNIDFQLSDAFRMQFALYYDNLKKRIQQPK